MAIETVSREALASDIEAAEAVEAGLAAGRSGVDEPEIRAAFGVEAARLALLAGRLAEGGLPRSPAPDEAFVRQLEARVADAFDTRVVPLRWRLPTSRFGRLTEMTVVGSLAAIIAVAAFLMGGGGFFGRNATAVPTANAETRTATAVAPEARFTAPAVAASEQARRPRSRQERHAEGGPPTGAPRTPATPRAGVAPPPVPSAAAPPTAPRPTRQDSHRA